MIEPFRFEAFRSLLSRRKKKVVSQSILSAPIKSKLQHLPPRPAGKPPIIWLFSVPRKQALLKMTGANDNCSLEGASDSQIPRWSRVFLALGGGGRELGNIEVSSSSIIFPTWNNWYLHPVWNNRSKQRRDDKTSTGNLVLKKKKRKNFICLSRIYIINKMICIMAKQNSSVILDLHFNEDISIIKKTGRWVHLGFTVQNKNKIVTKGKQTNVFQKINTWSIRWDIFLQFTIIIWIASKCLGTTNSSAF